MSLPTLSPQKVLLLALHLAATADVDTLAFLAAQHSTVLRKDLILRILLTYLPETVPSSRYVGFLRHLAAGTLANVEAVALDTSPVNDLSDSEAARKVRRLHLLPLVAEDLPGYGVGENGRQEGEQNDELSVFLFCRAHRVDEEAGLLTHLPELLVPFVDRSPALKKWATSVVLPLMRRNHEYYPQSPPELTLRDFVALPDGSAVADLLSRTATATTSDGRGFVGRDLGGMVGPWLHNDARWRKADADNGHDGGGTSGGWICTGWEAVLEWVLAQALQNWRVAVQAQEQWAGSDGFDLGPFGEPWLGRERCEYLQRRYARAGLASAYLIPEPSADALAGVYAIAAKLQASVFPAGSESPALLQHDAADLFPVAESATDLAAHASASSLRNDLLDESNCLTTPAEPAVLLLQALCRSALLLTQAGCPYTVRKTGELLLIGDLREQKSEVKAFVRAAARKAPQNDDAYWMRVRNEVLWLHDWGRRSEGGAGAGAGVFGRVPLEFIEAEILNALLANSRLSLAQSLYEASSDHALSARVLEGAVVAASMHAYDNASNPSRARGGLKKCNDIIHAFPRTIPASHPAARRIEALLRATHTLSDYRLVLKQGEPFSPVVLRVHSDPVSIIRRVLEQNPKSYTKIQDFLDLGANMISAGLAFDPNPRSRPDNNNRKASDHGQDRDGQNQTLHLLVSEKRITAMCVEAALREDDFETAYSYVINRLGASDRPPPRPSSPSSPSFLHVPTDQWSWAAALQAGQYVRTARTLRPTHLGTASGNLEIRHLEHRLECLATALRIAPASQLQEILTTFRRCEEHLDAALRQEAASEDAWDAAADMHAAAPLPGAFLADPTRAAARASGVVAERTRPTATGDDAPMSLFDLSRATARIATQNLSALSGLQRPGSSASSPGAAAAAAAAAAADDAAAGSLSGEGGQHGRVRKRDQLREAAMGTLVSGVGWLVGAQPVDKTHKGSD